MCYFFYPKVGIKMQTIVKHNKHENDFKKRKQ